MSHVLQRLRDSGIRWGIVAHPHGFEWWLACSLARAQWDDGWDDTFDGAVAKLAAAVVKRYPECDFAKEVRA